MHKIISSGLLISSLLTTPPLYAQNTNEYGLYIGGDLTWTNWDFRMNNDMTSEKVTLLFDSLEFNLNANDFNGEGRVGGFWRWNFDDNRLLTAIEVFGAGQNASDFYWGMTKFTLNALGQEVTSNWNWGVELKQGYFINEDWLFFAKLGFIQTGLEIETEVGLINPGKNEIYSTRSDSTSLNGVRFGAGLEAFVNDYVSIVGQALYSAYQNYDHTFSFNDVLITDDVEMKTHSIQFGLGVNVYFW